MGKTKTDNGNLQAKLALRRYFLRKYHAEGSARVLDCCQGSAVIWSRLRDEFELESYWGVDLNPKRGRLKVDSVRILEQPGWSQNVIDVDTYGVPWKHFDAILRNGQPPLTVFMTLGSVTVGGGSDLSKIEANALGIRFDKLKLPQSFAAKLLKKLAVNYLLRNSYAYNTIVSETVESLGGEHARYFGLRLESRVSTHQPQTTNHEYV